MHYHLISVLLVLMTILPVRPAVAGEWSAAEIRAMPPYCAGRYARHNNPAEYKRWESIYGADFLHVHHLCDGYGFLNRYPVERHPQKKKFLLQSALGNLNYIISRASPSFPLLPSALLARAKVYVLQQQPGLALNDAQRAIELDRQLVDAYALSAEVHAKAKQTDKALEVVIAGLRHVPGNVRLQRLYDNYGGKPPYPEPIEQLASKLTQITGDDTQLAKEAARMGSPKPQSPSPEAGVADAANIKRQSEGSDNTASGTRGTPANPWCRFCPETDKK